VEITISDAFRKQLDITERHQVLYGGSGSGKSCFAARKIFYRCMVEGNHKFLVIRKVAVTLKESVIEIILEVLAENNIQYNYNKSDLHITFYNKRGQLNKILFLGLDDSEKIKSIANISGIWIEEATELSEKDYDQLNLRLRHPKVAYEQIIITFNPDESVGAWIKEKFFNNIVVDETGKPIQSVMHSTILDNPDPEVRKRYISTLQSLTDAVAIKIYRDGEWAAPEGQIYEHIKNIPYRDYPKNPDEVIYGIDWGFNNPTAIIEILIKDQEFYFRELLYEQKLTDSKIIRRLEELKVDENALLYGDSEAPDKVEGLCESGYNCIGAKKGKGSVFAGITWIKNQKCYTCNENVNLNSEIKKYRWIKKKDGTTIDEPVKMFDHGLDAVRYALYTHYFKQIDKGFIAVPDVRVY